MHRTTQSLRTCIQHKEDEQCEFIFKPILKEAQVNGLFNRRSPASASLRAKLRSQYTVATLTGTDSALIHGNYKGEGGKHHTEGHEAVLA